MKNFEVEKVLKTEDNEFRRGDIIEILTDFENTLIGKIIGIENHQLTIDMSDKYSWQLKDVQYINIDKIKILNKYNYTEEYVSKLD